jgi:hypothetical protein
MTNNIKSQCQRTILSTSQAYLDIQKEECDPLIEDIEFELKQLYPTLSGDQIKDWSMEFINWETPKDRKAIFKRLDKMFGKKK